MSVIALNPEQPQIEFVDGKLQIHSFGLDGSVVELAQEMAITEQPTELARLLCQVVETGAIVIAHGQRRASVEAIASEIDRLMATTAETTEELPTLIQARLNDHLTKLASTLDARFDGGQTSSVQHQLKELVKGATTEQVRTLLNELLGENGKLAATNEQVTKQLGLVAGHSSEMLAKVTSLIDKLEQKQRLEEQHQRSTHKGAPFEDQVDVELAAIHGRLGDDVRCVKHETGLIPGSAAGDFVVTIDSQQTGGREAKIVIEAKTGKLSGPKTHEAIKEAIANRGAQAGILVFDGAEDAPLRGRHYMAYPDGEIVAVLDEDNGTLAFEVACIQARLFAIGKVAAAGKVDAKWIVAQCDRLSQVIEQANTIKRGSAAARRGLETVDGGYKELREQALIVLEEIKAKLA